MTGSIVLGDISETKNKKLERCSVKNSNEEQRTCRIFKTLGQSNQIETITNPHLCDTLFLQYRIINFRHNQFFQLQLYQFPI